MKSTSRYIGTSGMNDTLIWLRLWYRYSGISYLDLATGHGIDMRKKIKASSDLGIIGNIIVNMCKGGKLALQMAYFCPHSQYAPHGLTHERVTGHVAQVSILPQWYTAYHTRV
ncbi:Protein gp29 [Gossypium arboreum]|uniref:Protein gp29 n=1 Tax=Gossypium arboreum TaxID=29729 RepID=A0A0B0Q0Z6_GOSAR|nr:Protein gp29 [Gossypium arboreum]